MMKNKFYKILTVGFLVISSNFTFAQFGVNGIKRGSEMYCFSDKLKEEDYKKFKKCTTYIICPKKLVEDRENVQQIFDEAWDYNDIVVISDEEVKDYIDKKNSAFFTVGILTDGTIKELYMELWMVKDLSKAVDNYNRTQIARFCLYYQCEFQEVYKKNGSQEFFNYLSNEADIRNFKPGIVANYLKFIESYLKDKLFLDCHDPITNKEELPNLKDDTLFITDNIKTKFLFTAFKRGCESDEEADVEKIMSKYPYNYKLISFDELDEKILSGDDFYYAICLKSDEMKKHLSVYKSKTGECIYNRKDMDSEFKSKDFKELADKIGK